MMFSEPLNQYEEILKDAIRTSMKESGAKLAKNFAGAVKHGLEIMGIGLLDVANNKCMMLRAHQTIGNSALKMRNKTLVEYYISVMKRYSKKLLSITDIVVADAFFSTSTFEKGISELGFYLVSRFRDNACLHYIPKKEKRRGRPRVKGDKIDLANLNLSCMEELYIDGLDGKAYTFEAYAKALKKRVRLVIWRMPVESASNELYCQRTHWLAIF